MTDNDKLVNALAQKLLEVEEEEPLKLIEQNILTYERLREQAQVAIDFLIPFQGLCIKHRNELLDTRPPM